MSPYLSDGPYTQHATHCKFCHKPITLEVSESYDTIGDKLKLFPAAACNPCADIRVDRRQLEAKISRAAMTLAGAGPKATVEFRGRFHAILEKLLQDYAKLIARWHHLSGMSWDDAALDTIMDHPTHWPQILQTLWTIFQDSNPSRITKA
jgi:hypothetical protein